MTSSDLPAGRFAGRGREGPAGRRHGSVKHGIVAVQIVDDAAVVEQVRHALLERGHLVNLAVPCPHAPLEVKVGHFGEGVAHDVRRRGHRGRYIPVGFHLRPKSSSGRGGRRRPVEVPLRNGRARLSAPRFASRWRTGHQNVTAGGSSFPEVERPGERDRGSVHRWRLACLNATSYWA